MRTKKQFTMVWINEAERQLQTYTGDRLAIEVRLKGDDIPSTLILIEGVEIDFAVEKQTVVTFSSDKPRTRKPRVKAEAAEKPKRTRKNGTTTEKDEVTQ